MRTLSFPLVSLGSSAMGNLDAADVASWIHGNKGVVADIISYQMDRLFQMQKECVAEPAAGGDFYGKRIEEMLGIHEGTVDDEYILDSKVLREDLHFLPRKTVFSLPSFTQLSLEDNCYKDNDEFLDAGTKAYQKICREYFDQYVPRLIIHSNHPNEVELEKIHGKRYLWWVSAEYYESLLEISHNLVLSAGNIDRLDSLFDSYEIRNLYLVNPTEGTMKQALELFDKEYLFISGYAPEKNQEVYWKELSEIKCVLARQ